DISLDYCYWDVLRLLRILLEKKIAAIKGYRGGSGDELETSMEDVEGVCGAPAFMEKKEEMWPFLRPRNVLRWL
nr:hypothetical protein [Tanacetum cinerariifolium]